MAWILNYGTGLDTDHTSRQARSSQRSFISRLLVHSMLCREALHPYTLDFFTLL